MSPHYRERGVRNDQRAHSDPPNSKICGFVTRGGSMGWMFSEYYVIIVNLGFNVRWNLTPLPLYLPFNLSWTEWLSPWRLALHQCTLSTHSLCGRPTLFFPSIIPKTNHVIFRLSFILHVGYARIITISSVSPLGADFLSALLHKVKNIMLLLLLLLLLKTLSSWFIWWM